MTKLLNAPLQEAIFEIRWELDVLPESNQQIDTGYAFAQGKLQNLIKSEFPFYSRKVPAGIPDQLIQYQTVHQYWKRQEEWPVIQLGPGIFTVNETEKNYSWQESYLPLITKALRWITEAYDSSIRINSASLRYIDFVVLNKYDNNGDWEKFIKDNLNFSFENKFDTRGSLTRFQFDQMFDLKDNSSMQVVLSSGKERATDEDAFIWQTAVIKNQIFDEQSLVVWLNEAHSITSNLFREMTKSNFYDSFK